MGLALKSLLVLLLIAIGGGFIINQVPSWKQKVIEIINPAAKEARLLGELTSSLDDLNNLIDGAASSKNPRDLDEKIKKSQELLRESKSLVSEISLTNNKNSGIVKQQIGKIVDAFLDKTPYPADHLSPATNSTSPLVCPPKF